jgi:hypothetical protein
MEISGLVYVNKEKRKYEYELTELAHMLLGGNDSKTILPNKNEQKRLDSLISKDMSRQIMTNTPMETPMEKLDILDITRRERENFRPIDAYEHLLSVFGNECATYRTVIDSLRYNFNLTEDEADKLLMELKKRELVSFHNKGGEVEPTICVEQ